MPRTLPNSARSTLGGPRNSATLGTRSSVMADTTELLDAATQSSLRVRCQAVLSVDVTQLSAGEA